MPAEQIKSDHSAIIKTVDKKFQELLDIDCTVHHINNLDALPLETRLKFMVVTLHENFERLADKYTRDMSNHKTTK